MTLSTLSKATNVFEHPLYYRIVDELHSLNKELPIDGIRLLVRCQINIFETTAYQKILYEFLRSHKWQTHLVNEVVITIAKIHTQFLIGPDAQRSNPETIKLLNDYRTVSKNTIEQIHALIGQGEASIASPLFEYLKFLQANDPLILGAPVCKPFLHDIRFAKKTLECTYIMNELNELSHFKNPLLLLGNKRESEAIEPEHLEDFSASVNSIIREIYKNKISDIVKERIKFIEVELFAEAADKLGEKFGLRSLGQKLFPIYWDILGNNRLYPIITEIAKPTFPSTPLQGTQERVSSDAAETSQEDEETSSTNLTIHSVDREVDQKLLWLAAGFNQVGKTFSVSRWEKLQVKNSSDIARVRAFDKYGDQNDDAINRSIIRHSIPFFLFLNMPKELLAIYLKREQGEKDLWKLKATLCLGPKEFPGYGELILDDEGNVYHNYFFLEKRAGLEEALSSFRSFAPKDSFNEQKNDPDVYFYNDFRFSNEGPSIILQNMKSSIKCIVHPWS